MLTCGVDIGARSIEVVLLDEDRVVGEIVTDSGRNPRETAEQVFLGLLADVGVREGDVARTVATGYGRRRFRRADAVFSEISCHAAGVSHRVPHASTIVDIGGQDSKAIRLMGPGRVSDFAMNDRCAAGTGKFIEMVAQTLGLSLEASGALALEPGPAIEISAMCAVFAESEIVGLLHGGAEAGPVLRGVFRSVARRTLSLLGRLEGDGEIVFTGGVARNPAVVKALERLSGRPVRLPASPQTTGALGAALLAGREC